MLFPARRCFNAVACFLTLALLLVFQAKVEARVSNPVTSVLVQWDANPEPDIVGYKLYVGTESGVYSRLESIDEAQAHPSFLLTDLTLGQPYFCVITAVNGSGFQSGFSEEFIVNEPQGHLLATVEAEDGVFDEGFTQSTDGTSTWLESPDGSTGGTTMVPVSVFAQGSYIVWCRVQAPSIDADSFFVTMDDDPQITFHVYGTPNPDPGEISQDWIWKPIQVSPGTPMTFDLSPGEHFIEFELREAGTKLDRVLVTNDAGFVPSGNFVAAPDYLDVLGITGGGNLAAGSQIRLEVEAVASNPIQIQWFRDGIPLDGQTSEVLLIPGAGLGDSGSYTVELTSNSSTVTAGPLQVAVSIGDPLRVVSFSRLSATQLEFQTTGQLGTNVTLEASTDLQSWTAIDTRFNADGLFLFNDPAATGQSSRYYRLTTSQPDLEAGAGAGAGGISIRSFTALPDGLRRFELDGTPPAGVYVYSSLNLVDWTAVGAATENNNAWEITDGDSVGAPRRFYRLYLPEAP